MKFQKLFNTFCGFVRLLGTSGFRVFEILNIIQEAKQGLGAIDVLLWKVSGDYRDIIDYSLNFLFTLAKRYIFVTKASNSVLHMDNFIVMLKQYYNLDKSVITYNISNIAKHMEKWEIVKISL